MQRTREKKSLKGLNANEVLESRKLSGYNEIVPTKFQSNLHQLFHILTNPMGMMLLSLGFIYWFLGNRSDAIILFISFIPITIVDLFLEFRAKKALKALSASLKKIAKVIRDNQIIEISIREIVPGDLVIFEEGQGLPADGEVIECEQLYINEAALTGESIPVNKNINDSFFAGTNIITGRGVGKIINIGSATKFGKIAQLLETVESETSPLKQKINAIIKKVLIVAIVLACVLFIVTFIFNRNWAQSLIESLTFGMAAIPEEFPLVFTLYLSLGAYRLSKHGVLVKSLPSVETLGSVDVICTDKTGTLTEGKFQLELLEAIDTHFTPDEQWQFALMACEEKPIDAMEMAILKKGESHKNDLQNYHLQWDYPFEPKGKHMSHVWQENIGKKTIMAMKGSAEGVLEHCNFDNEKLKKINARIEFWASKGKRVLALAGKNSICVGDRLADEKNLEFIGLLIFSDPIRTTAKIAVEKCQEAGIEVKMLTGDHPLTAHAIADELEIKHIHEAMFTGHQLTRMNQEERKKAFLNGAIFSRLLPEQKYEMVEVLKEYGKIVAMTGDGINDAPALKIADIGISMGENATDVARSSALMILMKNDFNGIVQAVFEGRKVFANLKRSFSYLISFHFPILFFAFIPPLLNQGNILLPIHIVLLQLVVHPISAFSFENLPSPKSHKDKTLMNKKRFIESLLSGALLSIGSLILYHTYLDQFDIIHARSITIATLLLGNIFLVFTETYPVKSLRFIYTTLGLIFFILGILYVPIFSKLFHLQAISFREMALCFGVGGLATLPSFLLINLRKHSLSA